MLMWYSLYEFYELFPSLSRSFNIYFYCPDAEHIENPNPLYDNLLAFCSQRLLLHKPFSFQMLSVLRETSAVSLKVACALLHINLVYGESCAQGAEGHAAFYQVVKSYRL